MKLNKKGFTLIELLAVIVILAIILVITIPSVLGSIRTARQSSFENAAKTIVKYVQQQYDSCLVGEVSVTGAINASVITASNCSLVGTTTTNYEDFVKAAGYDTDDIVITSAKIENSKVEMSFMAPASGQFGSNDYNNTASTYTP